MKWHTNVTIGDLHYLRSKFAQSQGLDAIRLGSFNKVTEAFYYNRQFAVNGDYFLTWAFLTPEWEFDYLKDGMAWVDHMNAGKPWIMEAYMPNMALSAIRDLRKLIPGNILRFKRGDYRVDSIIVPDLTE